MPVLEPTPVIDALQANLSSAQTATQSGIEVICAWPVSGQYGAGSRVLYYVLVAACIFARRVEWLRNACLAAALLFPIVAAIHAIVLVSEHIDEAVDMDVYGAFQFCAIGALVGPVTVRISGTYNDEAGRNAIFVWALVVLAGLISLTVEFYRIHSFTCYRDDFQNLLSPNPSLFPYGNASCGVICDEDNGPFSPLRGGSAKNIYLIPSPTKFNFNAATLLSAACCIPAILLCVSTWLNILEINYKKIFGNSESLGEIKGNIIIKMIRKYAVTVIFGGAVLTILILGERNLFSPEVDYQTEPLANIGQWAPIAGTGLAVLGSVYVLLAEAMARERTRREQEETEPGSGGEEGSGPLHQVARFFISFSDHISHPKQHRFDTSDFRRGSAMNFPEIPGESLRNRALSRTRSTYNEYAHSTRDSSESVRSGRSRLSRQRSNTLSNGGSKDALRLDRTSTEMEQVAGAPDLLARTRTRRDTLEVPTSPMHRSSTQGSLPVAPDPDPVSTSESPSAPAIVVSSDIPSEEDISIR
ncbi:hypothetical protein Slin15195_G098300 [Septoria linicola]|uniref:Uncharacterized protein n=1 Tax=Septoria linicola TaxID=215465 RepID=A0A9Q9B3E3_9PEZI|nr:hypothetical protein Slin15195_G098300 [Septoria linicola]